MQLLVDGTVLEVNRDVTELSTLAGRQETLARDLSTAAAKFEAVFNQTAIFAGIMDLQGTLREANDLALEWCGYTREQVVDRPFWDTPWWRGSEETKARNSLRDGSSCRRISFSRRASILGSRRGRTHRGLCDASDPRPRGSRNVPASYGDRHYRTKAC